MEPHLHLTHLTRDPAWIAAADSAGIERIGVDIERIGKHERQSLLQEPRISDHELKDLETVNLHCSHALPFARLNRPHKGTGFEVETAIHMGAKSLMLPGFNSASEVSQFVKMVDTRAEVILLIETRQAISALDEILATGGIDEVMVGLNDMALQHGLAGPMMMALSPVMDDIAERVHNADIAFGFGGVSRPERLDLPTNPDALLARHVQLGSSSAWIARTFTNDGLTTDQLPKAITSLRERFAHWSVQPADIIDKAVRSLHPHLPL